jgi:hypothetical protein
MKDKMLAEETGPSKRAQAHEDWDPEWTEERFALLLKCNFASCGELVAVSGNASYDHDIYVDEEGLYQQDMVRHFEPISLVPAPLAIRPIEKTPEVVKEALRKAANLLWQSSESAANQIRQAVEHLMDEQKVKKLVKTGGKKLSLHARLLEFEKTDADNGKILRAIKWIGNDGSHQGGVTREEVLDAFDMMELALSNIYDDTAANIMKKVHAVIKAKEKKPRPKTNTPSSSGAGGSLPTGAPNSGGTGGAGSSNTS